MAEYIIEQGIDPKVFKEFKDLETMAKTISKSLKGFTITNLSSGADEAMIKRLNAETSKLIAQEEKLRLAVTKANTAQQQKVGYINDLVTEVKQLQQAYYSLSQAELNSTTGTQTLTNLKTKREELARLKESYGDATMRVGQYSRGANGLRQSLSMLTSEMPNFAQSFRIGMMSLSNNWMGLSQSIALVRQEQKMAMADFWKNFWTIAKEGRLIMYSSDTKTNMLIQEYGESIFGLTETNFKKLGDIIMPELNKSITKYLKV